MKKQHTFYCIFFVSMMTLLTSSLLAQAVDNDYWIVVPANYNYQDGGVSLCNPACLSLVAEKATNVRVQAASSTYTVAVTASGVTIPNRMPYIPEHKIIVQKAVHAWSLDSLPFRAELAIAPEEWGEGTWCIPTNSLGMSYRIVTYKNSPPSHPDQAYSGVTRHEPEFAIVATEDVTHITIDFPPGSGLASIQLRLNKGDVYHVACGKPDVNIDPTGTRITADKRIAVFTGQSTAVIPFGGPFGNALMEEMLPIESWGELHMIASDPHLSGDIFRFVADCDSTQIFNDGTPIATINGGKFYEIIISGAHEIYSTKPITVAKYTQAGYQLYNGDGGPSMLIVPSVDRYFDSTRFYTVSVSQVTGNSKGALPYVVVITPTAYTSLVEFDGIPIEPLNKFVPISNYKSPIQYSWAYVPLPSALAGGHTLNYTTPPAANPYSLYGYYTTEDDDRDENLTWNVGYRGSSGVQQPRISVENIDLDMGTLTCDTSITMGVTATNVGYAPLIISSISGLGGSPFTLVSPTFPDTIKPQDTVSLVIKFTSVAPGVYTKTLFLTTNEGGACGSPIDTIRITARKERAAITSKPASYDFGDVTCESYETTVTVINVGTVDVQVTDSTFTQAGIVVASPTLPVTIRPGSTKQFTIRLDASKIPVGSYASTLELKAQPCDLSAEFRFTANRKALVYTVSPPVTDFGITNINKVSSGSVVFDNQSDLAVRIGSARFDNTLFTVTTSFPQTVAPHSTFGINFTCYPADTIKYESTLTIKIDSPCADDRTALARVEGASVCPQARPSEIIGATPGEYAWIPIIVDPSTKLTSTQKIEATVKWDKELLRYAGEVLPTIGALSNPPQLLSDGGVSFTITTNGLPSPTAEIAKIKVQSLLAPYGDGKIDVSTSSFTLQSGEKIAGLSCPVPFSLGEDCVKRGGLRKRSTATIEGIYPNPSNSSARVVIKADGSPEIKLEVYDRYGRKIETLADGKLPNEKNELVINTSTYSNGIYFCRMMHEGKIITREFNVQR